MEKKKLYAAIVGYGNRGQVYGDYSLQCPDEFGVAAVIDPKEFKLREAKERYGLSDERLFCDFASFLKSGIKCDFVINATMDQFHYETTMEILGAGYDLLVEKPIVPNEKELLDIKNLAEKKGVRVFVCHVLRYSPFYTKIKEILNSGVIGKIMTMEMNEHVCRQHYLASYDRGKWNSEDGCGSGFLLAKCCHDMDIMCWLNNASAPETVASMVSAVRHKFGSITHLVCNAGISVTGLLEDMDLCQCDSVIDTNLKGVIYTVKEVIPDMVKRKSGVIVSVSSIWGKTGASCEAVYSASKAGVIAFSEAMAKELGLSGIRVNAVCPGCIDTDMMRKENFTACEMQTLIDETAIGRIGTPKDVADVVSFLLSDKSSFITGQAITVDGGFI